MGSEPAREKPGDVALWRAAVVLALAVAMVGLVAAGSGPFERGWLGHNGARYAIIARNHARLGLTYLGGAPLISSGMPAPAHEGVAMPSSGGAEIYAHHPPALGWVIALIFRLVGVSEAAACAVPIVSTVLLLLLFALLVRQTAGARAGAFAVLAAAAQPMLSVYGSHVDVQGTPVLLLSVATLAGYRHWLRGGSVAWMLCAAALASGFDWYGLYMPVACAAHLLWTRRRVGAATGLALWSLGLFGFWLAWLTSLPGVEWGEVVSAAGVRGALALSGSEGKLGAQVAAWYSETLALMPVWPALLGVTAWVAWLLRHLAPWPAESEEGAGEPLSPSWLILLLLAPPVVHAALFPAGMLQHGYWLFGLPLPIAAGVGIFLSAWPPGLACLATASLLLLGAYRGQQLLEVRDPLPRLIGEELATHTAPGDVIFTNYDTNPFVPGRADDSYVLMRPEVAFYADRVVRGGLGTAEELTAGLARRPDAGWFLLVPWPAEPPPALPDALRAMAIGDPVQFPDDPRVFLYRLAP